MSFAELLTREQVERVHEASLEILAEVGLLVRYAPSRTVDIKAGENHGMKVTYRNVVLSSEQIATWDGATPLRLTVTPAAQTSMSFPADTRHAILAQQIGKRNLVAGPILAAVRLD